MVAGCSSYQPTKNVWKGTKDVWYTYVSPPASVDYGEKGDLSPRALALTNCMMGLDVELGRFERTMINADKPPTRQWMDSLFAAHPWLDGFAGVKYDGTLLGQEPANPLKQLDFIPLLYEDKKQGSRALRAGVQQTPMGPEVMLAAPCTMAWISSVSSWPILTCAIWCSIPATPRIWSSSALRRCSGPASMTMRRPRSLR